MEKIYFYAPDKNTHHLFNYENQQWIGLSNNSLYTNWIVRTYLNMKSAGLYCEVVDDIPKQGIVIADRGTLRDTLGNQYPYFGEAMLICAKGDDDSHPSAHLHIVQNLYDLQNRKNSLWNPYYIPHWPQPGLIPRSEERSFLIENVAFMGTGSNLTKELLSEKWLHSLSSLGCKWYPIFNKEKSAFLALRRSELDFLIVRSLEEAIEAVKRLKNNPDFYLAMVENGRERAEEFTEEIITESWMNFFHIDVPPQYEKWLQMSEFERRLLFLKRYLRLKIDGMQTRINKFSP
jgi:hypothetical protein